MQGQEILGGVDGMKSDERRDCSSKKGGKRGCFEEFKGEKTKTNRAWVFPLHQATATRKKPKRVKIGPCLSTIITASTVTSDSISS